MPSWLGLIGAAKPDISSGAKNWVKALQLSPFFISCLVAGQNWQ
jgi:hypothetical protein